MFTYASGLTRSFGGKVIFVGIPTVQCTLPGPLVIVGTGAVAGLPIYTTNIRKIPRAGDWILGRVSMTPQTGSCTIPVLDDAPFPVRNADYYGVSKR